VLLFSLMLACAAPHPVDPRVRALVAETEAAIEEWGVPGAAVVIVEGDRTWFISAGTLDRETGQSVSPNARFRIGSVSKTLTGMLVADAHERGVIDLDAPPDVPELAGRPDLVPPTLRHYMRHESGLQAGGVPSDCLPGPERLGPALAEVVPDLEAWLPPGALFLYSNIGVALSGRAVEHAAGVPFPDLVQARIFDPAGMTSATYDAAEAAAGRHATGHRIDPESGRLVEQYTPHDWQCPGAYPSGGLLLTPEDLGTLLGLLLSEGDGVLSPGAWQTFLQADDPDPTHYGLGVIVGEDEEHRVLSHGGSMSGYRARIEAWPDDGFGVAVVVNADHRTTRVPARGQKPTDLLAARVSRAFLDLPEKSWDQELRPREEWGARYGGTYRSDQAGMGSWTVWDDGETLWARDRGREMVHALVPYGRDDFQYELTSGSTGLPVWGAVDFRSDGEGGPSMLIMGKGIGWIDPRVQP
jgi:CubicO group peptidase (beta-lactamase class C family)